jgi:hypothetical protein
MTEKGHNSPDSASCAGRCGTIRRHGFGLAGPRRGLDQNVVKSSACVIRAKCLTGQTKDDFFVIGAIQTTMKAVVQP